MSSPDLAAVASALAHPTRAAFVLALLDGRAWTARELAEHAGVARSSASEHLDVLAAAGFALTERQGRHRYVRLDPDVAPLVEALAARAPAGPPSSGFRAVSRDQALAAARTCYDHLAGRLGVAVTDALVAREWLGLDLALAPAGRAGLAALGVAWAPTRRPAARPCLDWTERRPHLGGAVGAAICAHALDNGWVRRRPGSRALDLTPAGIESLRSELGVDAGL